VSRGFSIVFLCLLVTSALADDAVLPDGALAMDALSLDGRIVTAPAVPLQAIPLRTPALRPEVCGPGRVLCPPSALPQQLLVGTTGVGLLLGSAALGIAAGSMLPNWHFERYGRPDPRVTSLGLGVGFGVTVAASQLLVPYVARLGDDAHFASSVAVARESGWRYSRWAVLAGGVGLATLLTGSAMERREFGSGQAVMGAGGATLLLSGLLYCGLELVGVLQGAQRSRQPRE
jgi:hypothetical protein